MSKVKSHHFSNSAAGDNTGSLGEETSCRSARSPAERLECVA